MTQHVHEIVVLGRSDDPHDDTPLAGAGVVGRQARWLRGVVMHATVPVINMETITHPCQERAHVMALQEHFGTPDLRGKKYVLTWTSHPKALNTAVANSALTIATRMGMDAGHLEPCSSAMPQGVRLTPGGTRFLVAHMLRNGIWVIKASTQTVERFIPAGKGARGIYPDRQARRMFVSNRGEGSISVLNASSLAIIAKWKIPGGGSPDMGGVTADGSQLWLSGRYNSEVYVFNTATGALIKRIRVNAGPHGILVWPQPGSFSLGHPATTRYHPPPHAPLRPPPSAAPRRVGIKKTVQDIAYGDPVEQNLMLAGHSAYRFKQDPFYSNKFTPTVKELVDRILTGD